MKIMLVRPRPESETIGLQHVMLVEPLELEVIASTVSNEEECVIIDMILEKKSIEHYIRKEKPDILALTGYITNVNTIIEYCKKAKEINKKIITLVGGIHVEVVPEDLNNKYIDYRMVRNATTEFPRFIEFIKGKSRKPQCVFEPNEIVKPKKLPPFDFYFPHPNRALTKRYRHKYFYIFHNKVALIKTAFGCPYKCNFCFCREITNHKYHPRPISDVLDELEGIDEKEIYIVDDDFLIDPKRIIKFLEGIEKRRIKKNFLIYGRSDFIVDHKNLIKRFKKNGLKTIIVGFESFDENELKQYNKLNNPRNNEESIHFMNSLGIDCFATIIINPSWQKSDFIRLEGKLKELKIKYVNLQPLTPLPKTGFKLNDDELVIKREDYAKWDLAHISIKPKYLSISDFYLEIIKLYRRILFRPWALRQHLRNSPIMQFRMIRGSYLVYRQYKDKYRETL